MTGRLRWAELVEGLVTSSWPVLIPPPGGEERGYQQGVLLGDGAAELGDDPRGHSQFQADGVDVAAAGAATGGDEHFVLLLGGSDLLDKGGQGLCPPVADGLTADLDDVDVGEEPLLGGYIQAVQKFPAHQALPHEPAFDMKPFSIPFSIKGHRFPRQWFCISARSVYVFTVSMHSLRKFEVIIP